jgi:hypothetical protein
MPCQVRLTPLASNKPDPLDEGQVLGISRGSLASGNVGVSGHETEPFKCPLGWTIRLVRYRATVGRSGRSYIQPKNAGILVGNLKPAVPEPTTLRKLTLDLAPLTQPSFARSRVHCDNLHSFSCSGMRSRNLSKRGIAWPEPAFAGFATPDWAIGWRA